MEVNKRTCVLITGGAGFIGSHLVNAYISNKNTVIVVDNFSSGEKKWVHPKAICYENDLNDTSSLQKILKKHRPQIIHHCAGHPQIRAALLSPQHDAQDNLVATLSLIQVLLVLSEKEKYQPKQIIFSSTSAVYGGQKKPPFSEKTECKPIHPYGIAKFAAEKYLAWYGEYKNVTITTFRYGNVYGPRQSTAGESGVIAKFMDALKKNTALKVFGEGDHKRDYIFVNDVVAASLLAAKKKIGGTFTLGTGKATSTLKLAEMCTQLIQPPAKIFKEKFRIPEQENSWLDSSLFSKKMSWKPKTSLAEGLQLTWKWYQTC